MTTTIIGIDPGVGGGLAFMDAASREVVVAKMPETDHELLNLLRIRAARGGAFAYLETVHAMPPTIRGKKVGGSVGNFKLGQQDGRLCMALTAAGIPYDRVAPLKWQTLLQCRTGGDKKISKARAAELFPELAVTHAIADALLLAEYGRRQLPLLVGPAYIETGSV
jgi:hypothetical protein